jgi:hypothetical protein
MHEAGFSQLICNALQVFCTEPAASITPAYLTRATAPESTSLVAGATTCNRAAAAAASAEAL